MARTISALFRLVLLAGALATVQSLIPCAAHAGPWVPEPNARYTQVALGYTNATDRQEFLLNLYGEFGVYKDLAIIAAIPIKGVNQQEPPPSGDDQNSFVGASASGGLRWQFVGGPYVMALQGDLKLPITGGSVDGTLQLLGGGSFGFLNGFAQYGGGLRARTGDDAHEWIFSTDAGFWFADPLLFVVEGRGRLQTMRDRDALLADREFQVGGQFVWRTGDRVDVGLDTLYTFETESIPRAVSVTAYIAFREAGAKPE